MSISILAQRENDLPIGPQEVGRESVFATKFSLTQLPDDGPDRRFTIDNSGSGTYNGEPPYILGRAPFDYQVNGTWGLNGHTLFTNTFTADAVRQMARDTLATGTTRFCPTIITSDFSSIVEALQAVRAIPEAERKALGIEGAHVEGRWIDRDKKGIHNLAHIVDEMTDEECGALCVYANKGILKIITVSPTKVTPAQIAQLTRAGALVSIGHSIATPEQVAEAIHAGAKHITHLWNAMSGEVKSRDAKSGVLNSALLGHGGIPGYPRVTSGLIADGHHVADESLALSLITHGAYGKHPHDARITLTTDAATYPGNESFEFEFGPGGQKVWYDHTTGMCVDSDTRETLGGAATTMAQCIQKVHSLGVSPRMAIFLGSGPMDGLLKSTPHASDHLALYDRNTLDIVGYIRCISGGVFTLLEGKELHEGLQKVE